MGCFRVVSACLGFKTHLAFFTLILLFTAVLFIFTAYVESLYGIYEYSTPSSIGGRGVVVIGSYSISPFTSLVNVEHVGRVLENRGCRNVFYETLSPAVLRGKLVIVRGVGGEVLHELSKYTVTEGVGFESNCFSCVWVGAKLAGEMGLSVGDFVVLYSPFSRAPFVLKVSGVVDFGSEPYSYELLVPLTVGRAFRGVGGEYASVAMVVVGGECGKSDVLRAFGVGAEKVGVLGKALVALKHFGSRVEGELYSSASDLLLGRFGLGRNVFTAAALALSFTLSVGLYIVGQAFSASRMDVLRLLYEQGVSMGKIRATLISLLTLYSGIASALSLIFVRALPEIPNVSFFNYPLKPSLDPLSSLALYVFASFFLTLGGLSVSVDVEG